MTGTIHWCPRYDNDKDKIKSNQIYCSQIINKSNIWLHSHTVDSCAAEQRESHPPNSNSSLFFCPILSGRSQPVQVPSLGRPPGEDQHSRRRLWGVLGPRSCPGCPPDTSRMCPCTCRSSCSSQPRQHVTPKWWAVQTIIQTDEKIGQKTGTKQTGKLTKYGL